jgi:hypothetical protein
LHLNYLIGVVTHVDGTAEVPHRHGAAWEDVMSITIWRKLRRDQRRDERARSRDARQFGRDLARQWIAGRSSVVRALTPGAGDSFVAAAFRYGLVEGTSIRDAAELAQAVLSEMGDTARYSTRRPRSGARSAAISQRDAAQRGVAWMAEQVLQGVGGDYRLGGATTEKIRSWSLERPVPDQRSISLTVAGRR